MIKILNYNELSYDEIFSRFEPTSSVEDVVSDIIKTVRANGDKALFDYTARFDKAQLSALQVTKEEIEEARSIVEPKFIDILERAAKNIRKFHEAQKRQSFIINDEDGIVMGQKVIPIEKVGLFNIVSAAMSQAFFTLSLGIGSMQIFGSYMSKDNTLAGEAIRITVLDTFVAIMSGLIIFPACFSFGVEPTQGPSLIFVTLPKIFINMPAGRLWGTLFFLFMSFASFSTLTAVFENIISSCMDNFGWSRKKSTLINCVFMLVMSMPCLLGFNVLSGVQLFGLDILGMEDFIVSKLLLPLGSLIILLFCSFRFGWGFDNYLKEANTGSGMKLPKALAPYFKYVLPLLLLFVFVTGFIQQ